MNISRSMSHQGNAIARSLSIAILLVFIIIKLLLITGRYHLPGWDESVYLSMGKYYWSFGEAGLYEDIRPPFLPLILGIFSGLEPEIYILVSDLVMLLFSVSCLYLTYLIAEKLYTPWVGLVSMSTLAITPVFFSQSLMIMTEVPAASLGLLSIYLFLKEKPFLSGLSVGLSFLMRYHMGLILISLFAFILLKKDYRKIPKVFLGFAIPASLLLISNIIINKAPLAPILKAGTHQYNLYYYIDDMVSNLSYYPIGLLKDNPLYSFIITSVAVFWRYRKRFDSLIWVTAIFFMLYFTYIPNKQLRFIVIFLPFLAILAALGLVRSFQVFRRYLKVILVIAIIASIIHSYGKDRITTHYYFDERPPYIDTYYRYFEVNGFSGTVLTMDPMPSVFNRAKFIWFYEDLETVMMEYREVDVDAIILKPASLPCPETFPRAPEKCEYVKGLLMQKIMRENDLRYQEEVFGQFVYILYTRNTDFR